MKSRTIYIFVIMFAAAVAAIVIFHSRHESSPPSSAPERVSLRLEWIPQAQFCGYIAAKDLGYYSNAGLDVDLRPAGPDFKPQVSVASGTDDIGVGVSNQVITARANGVPLKIVAQLFQDSANRYVLMQANAIHSLGDLRGKKVGLWLGGDEAEFVAMLKTAGMTLNDVQVVPQEFSVTPFLQDKYVLSEVTVYNELIDIQNQGYGGNKLQVLSPGDYNSAIVGDMLFTTEAYISKHPETLRKFIAASLQGWQYCIQQPDKAVEIVLKYNKDLDRDQQRQQLSAIVALIEAGSARVKGLGFMDPSAYETASRILVDSGQIKQLVDPHSVFDSSAWSQVSADAKKIP